MTEISYFIRELEEAVFSSESTVNKLFPQMDFRRNSKGEYQSPRKMDGSDSRDPRRDKTVIRRYSKTGRITVLEQGGENKSLLDFYLMLSGNTLQDALQALCSETGKELPANSGFNLEQYRRRQEKQNTLERLFREMEKALFTPEGKPVLDYLKTVRGYSEEYIKASPFGAISANMPFYEELLQALTYKEITRNNEGQEFETLKKPSQAVGREFVLAIAYISGGNIRGFEFRTIDPDKKDKYRSGYISAQETQKYFLFNLPGITLKGSGKQRNITIVEGELDALRGTYAGIPNLAGLSQGEVTKEQLSQAKKAGAEEVTFLLDTEELSQGLSFRETHIKQFENQDKVAKAVRTALDAGLKPYVCYLPQGRDGAKVDLDSYLKDLEGEALRAKGKEVSEMINRAESGMFFLYEVRLREAKYPEDGHAFSLENSRDRARLLDAVGDVYSDPACSLSDQIAIRQDFLQAFKTDISTLIEDFLRVRKERQDREKQKLQGKKLLEKSLQDIEKDPGETLSRLRAELPNLEALSEEASYGKLFETETEEEADKRREGTEAGILTDFTFKSRDGKEKEEFLLPAGAITLMCAPPSHGKSRILQNLALQVCDRTEEGEVLFFTLEESRDSVEDEFINIFAGETFSKNNLRTIASSRAEKDPLQKSKYFTGELGGSERTVKYNRYKHAKKTFYSKYLLSGKLRILEAESHTVESLTGIVNYRDRVLRREKGQRVKAVFIDYIQKLSKRGGFGGIRKEELANVANDLMDLSVKLNIPFVVASQLNRETLSPVEMEVQNISDATELEMYAGTVVLLWNSTVSPRFRSGAYYGGKNREKTEEALNFELRTRVQPGVPGLPGKLYALMGKNRKGLRNTETVLLFDGNTGRITQDKDFLGEGQTDSGQSREQISSGESSMLRKLDATFEKKPSQKENNVIGAEEFPFPPAE